MAFLLALAPLTQGSGLYCHQTDIDPLPWQVPPDPRPGQLQCGGGVPPRGQAQRTDQVHPRQGRHQGEALDKKKHILTAVNLESVLLLQRFL